MVSVDKASIIKLKIEGKHFEIMADADLAMDLRHGKSVAMKDVLAVDKVFTDAKKGDEASEHTMKEAFKTEDPAEVAKIIIQKGDIPLSSAYKQKLRDEKKNQIINMIHTNAVDPKTHLPHPPNRIESAMEEARYHVDEFEDVQKQVQNVLKAIRPILPIKFETKEIAIKIPGSFASKSYTILHSFGKVIKDDWLSDGSYAAVIEMPGGLEEDFYQKLNSLCHGEVESKVLKTK